MATEPNKELLSDDTIPTIAINGKLWPVPKLAIQQNQFVLPLVLQTLPALAEKLKAGAPDGVHLMARPEYWDYVRGSATVVYWGLQRGHKGLTREEFDDWAVDILELTDAVNVVARQTSSMRKPKAGETVPTGEAVASSPTGTP
jgi:hypothetical protein